MKQFHVTPENGQIGRNMYRVFLLFHFYYTTSVGDRLHFQAFQVKKKVLEICAILFNWETADRMEAGVFFMQEA